MSQEIYEKLKSELDECDWSMLTSYLEKQCVFIVDHRLDLIQVGTVIASNDVASVKNWQEEAK